VQSTSSYLTARTENATERRAAREIATGEQEELGLPVALDGLCLRLRSSVEHSVCGGELVVHVGACVEAVVSDLRERLGQHVLHEALQELDGRERRDLTVFGANGNSGFISLRASASNSSHGLNQCGVRASARTRSRVPSNSGFSGHRACHSA